ncbi:protein CLT1, chloroplastic-like isoform X2 [Olea europaea var. sylvestris]|uniref:protein CLT1, chloroplastic-like isoform X2 n=1 Tax=Olea europaea var. sylvestris TaxID=158386 RepID=UPI000C1D5445|nr:protein CLT1, chloroplastic-like isoform X2 [Olea europaea var. sylvestris]
MSRFSSTIFHALIVCLIREIRILIDLYTHTVDILVIYEMLTSYRRMTAGAAATPAVIHHIPRRLSVILQMDRPRLQFRGGVGVGEQGVLQSRNWVIEAAVGSTRVRGLRSTGEEEVKRKVQPPNCCAYDHEHQEAVAVEKSKDGDRRVEVVVAAATTVVLGVGNRVLYKLALVPLKQYSFFLAQLATFGYIVVYFSILYLRYQAGKVTDEMLSLPKFPLVAVGLLEALAAASGMAAGAILSGAAIPILSQSFLVWQLILSYIFLGRRYSFNQLFGCFLVAVGVIITVASGSGADSLMGAGIFWSLLMIISFLLQAADTILKEIIFLDAAQRLKGGSVDLFVINSFGSAYQAIFICLLIPFLSNLWGIPFSQLPNYFKDGSACFLNIGTMSKSCDGAPLLPLLFIIVNMCFNISLLHLLKISSAVVSCLASTFTEMMQALKLMHSLLMDKKNCRKNKQGKRMSSTWMIAGKKTNKV